MIHSSLKKTSEERVEEEGNYASAKPADLMGSSLNDDLGLTLLPGSQIQEEHKTLTGARGSIFQSRDHASQRVRYPAPRVVQELEREKAILVIAECGGDEDEDHDFGQYSQGSRHVQKRRKLHGQSPRQSPDFTGVTKITSDANPTDLLCEDCHPADRENYQVTEAPSVISRHMRRIGLSVSGPQSVEPSSGSTSILDPSTGRDLIENSPVPNISGTPQATACVFRPANNIIKSLDTISIDVKSGGDECTDVIAARKLPEYHQRVENPRIVVRDSHRTESNSPSPQRSKHLRLTQDIPSTTRQKVLEADRQKSTSWTSHFPRALKFSYSKRSARQPATSSEANCPFTTIPNHQHTHILNDHFLNPEARRKAQTAKQRQVLALSTDPSTSEEASAFRLDSGFLANKFHSVVGRHQHPSLRRSKSLPNFSLVQLSLNMDSRFQGSSPSLPTPPNEQQAFGSHHQLSSPLAGYGLAQSYSSNNTLNAFHPLNRTTNPFWYHSAPANTDRQFVPESEPIYVANDIGCEKLVDDFTFRNPTNQPANGCQIATTIHQQSNSQSMQGKQLDNPYGTQSCSGTLQQGSHALRQSSNTAQDSALLKARNQVVNLSDYNARILQAHTQVTRENAQLKGNLKALQQGQAELSRRLQFYEQKSAAVRLHHLEFALSQRTQQVTILVKEKAKLVETNERLQSEMKTLAAKTCNDASIATNILRKLGPTPSTTPDSSINYNYNNFANPFVDASTISEADSSRELNINPTAYPYSHTPPPTAVNPLLLEAPNSACETGGTEASTAVDDSLGIRQSTSHHWASSNYDQIYPTAYAPPFQVNSNDTSVNLGFGSPEKVTIDLTDESSSTFTSDNAFTPLTQEPLAYQQSTADQPSANVHSNPTPIAKSSRKHIGWLDGHQPSNINDSYHTNFGLTNSTQSSIAKSIDESRKSSKTTKAVFAPVATLSEADKEQMRMQQLAKQREKAKVYNKNFREKKRAEKQPQKICDATVDTPRQGNQARKSNKAQKRRQQAREPREGSQSRIAHATLNGESHEGSDGFNDHEMLLEEAPGIGVSPDVAMEGGDGSVGSDEALSEDDLAFAAMLEASMVADAVAQAGAEGGDSSAGDDAFATDNAEFPEQATGHGDSESEESEEE